jgi:hypothetical protein
VLTFGISIDGLAKWKISDKEIQAASTLTPYDRYQYFIKRVSDSKRMYSLVNNDGSLCDI